MKSNGEKGTGLLSEIDALKLLLDDYRPLDNKTIHEALELEYTFESNRIEGNTLTLQETDLVINKGLTIGGKSLREHFEAVNHKEAIDYVKEVAQNKVELSEKVLLDIHSLILRNIDKENAGIYRKVPVMITGSKHIPPQPYIVPKLMEEYFEFFEANKSILHPVVLAAELHERLVSIHPFIDGNGRTSRLIMNLILIRNGFPICNIKGDVETRLTYYSTLEESRTDTQKTSFINFVGIEVKNSLERYLKVLKG